MVTDKIVVITIKDPQTKKKIVDLKYVPVSKELQDMGEKLGDFLHAQREYKFDDSPFWKETRLFLERVCKELEKSCSGTILAPPIKESGNMVSLTIVPNGKELKVRDLKKIPMNIGGKLLMDVNHYEL